MGERADGVRGLTARSTRDPDDLLVQAAQRGDRRALDTLLRRHHDRIYAVCRRMTGSDSDAADATQEALISVVRGVARFDNRSRFATWAYRIAVNACLDELRRRSRRAEPGLPAIEHPARAGPPMTDQSVADRLDLDAALAGLSHEFRVVVVLRDQLGLDYADIAEVVGIPPGTVRSRLARARAALASHLGIDRRPGPGNRAPSAGVEEVTPEASDASGHAAPAAKQHEVT